MRCLKCRGKASIDIPRHHAAYCGPCFLDYFQKQVARAIKREAMLSHQDRILVAVSGGKDSLALWDVLTRLGYETTGLHIDLGIGEYSGLSRERTEAFAQERGLSLLVVDVAAEYGLAIPALAKATGRVACSGCGLSKRYIMNRQALEGGFTVLATGHNMDDEAATLLGNVLRWQGEYLERQGAVLASTHPKLARKVKPLYMLTERENLAYVLLRRIDFAEAECPNAKGATSILYKEALNHIEAQSPGSKQSFYLGFLEKGKAMLSAQAEETRLRECTLCGQATTEEVCAFCRMWERALGTRQHKAPAPTPS